MNNNNKRETRELVFIDRGVDDLHTLLRNMRPDVDRHRA